MALNYNMEILKQILNVTFYTHKKRKKLSFRKKINSLVEVLETITIAVTLILTWCRMFEAQFIYQFLTRFFIYIQ